MTQKLREGLKPKQREEKFMSKLGALNPQPPDLSLHGKPPMVAGSDNPSTRGREVDGQEVDGGITKARWPGSPAKLLGSPFRERLCPMCQSGE